MRYVALHILSWGLRMLEPAYLLIMLLQGIGVVFQPRARNLLIYTNIAYSKWLHGMLNMDIQENEC